MNRGQLSMFLNRLIARVGFQTALQSRNDVQISSLLLAVAGCCNRLFKVTTQGQMKLRRTAAAHQRAACQGGGRHTAAADRRSRHQRPPRRGAWAGGPAARAAAARPPRSRPPAPRSCLSPSPPPPSPSPPSMTSRCAATQSLASHHD